MADTHFYSSLGLKVTLVFSKLQWVQWIQNVSLFPPFPQCGIYILELSSVSAWVWVEKRLRLLAQGHSFSKDGGCPDVSPGVWSLVSLPQACRHHSVPAGAWLPGLCHSLASFSPNSETILWGTGKPSCFPAPCWGHWRLMGTQGLCLWKSILTPLSFWKLPPRAREAGVECKSSSSESPTAFSRMLSPTFGDFMGVGGGKTGKTGSSWSHILSISCLASKQRALTSMAKNVMSLFSGPTMTPFLKW